MRFKLDENLNARVVPLLEAAGYEADTVLAEGLGGTADRVLFEVCRATGQTLLTLDLDFAQPLRFPPQGTAGIVVLRPGRPTLAAITATLGSLLAVLPSASPADALWIVEPDRVRTWEAAPGPGEEQPRRGVGREGR
jgi:predicted nuclease of predicted toxin-antitoxin system